MYTLWIYFRGYSKEFLSVSKADIKLLIEHFKEDPNFYGYDMEKQNA